MKLVICLMLTTTFLVGCGKKSTNSTSAVEKKMDIDTVQETTEEPLGPIKITKKDLNIDMKVKRIIKPASDLSNFEEFKANLNTYSVTFSAVKERYPFAQVSCFKMNFDEKKNYRHWPFDEEGEKAELRFEIEKYDPIEVKYLCVISANGKNEKIFEFSLKKSFLISDKTDIMKARIGNESEIGLLVLDQGAVLTMGNRNVKLKAEGIVSNKGILQTLSDEEIAATNADTNGDDGGLVQIETKELTGELKIELRGANGGKTTKMALDKNTPAAVGANGQGCWGKQSPSDSWCEGKNGSDGEKGNSGYSGQNGGNTGSIKLAVTHLNKNASLAVAFTPGIGSQGTPGGKGQPGGAGGKGITVSWETYSNKGENVQQHKLTFKDGNRGRDGSRGDAGTDGINGKAVPSSIQIGEEISQINNDWHN
ncbi:MAG TPA: hypothetical protein VNJ08_12215 [Bacteriovoracaceae bacterium]|nr:hypothetical protein [Bacteriovoracaceae bacterium]